MRLAERGIRIDAAGPSLYGFPGGERLLLGEDIPESQAEIARYSAADARALPEFEDALARPRRGGRAADGHDAAEPRARQPRRGPGAAADGRARPPSPRRRSTTPCSCSRPPAPSTSGEFFESEVVMAAMGWHAINDSVAGPSTPGTAYVLLHDHAAEQAGGGLRTWGFVRGGIGLVTEAMADAAREAGAEIRTGAEVERVVVEGGRATGVELADGTRDRRRPGPLQRRSAADLLRPRRRRRVAGAVRRLAAELPLRGHEHEDQPRRRPAAAGDRDAGRRAGALPRRDHGVRRLRRRHGPRPVRGPLRPPRHRPPRRGLHPDLPRSGRSPRRASTC